ncbi:hypothetical protein [Algoriphagus resistens]|uniref:hypothetical protein n=1 Tax=Algoriphagus resistens TaxID=1750590 RepID=UPI000716AD38|nr:hypothetical protein [Algoriphagus resistens]
MPEFDFTTFVKNLPQEKLVELVLKFAPNSFREEVSNQHLDVDKARTAFDRIAKDIKGLFDDRNLLYEPYEFEASLEGLSERLSGLWDRFPVETGKLFLFCIQKIEEVQDDGMLYRDYPEEYFEGDTFLAVIQRYILILPFGQKIEFVEKVEKELESSGYSTFSNFGNELHLIYKDSEKPLMKEVFLKSLSREDKPNHAHYYRFLRDILNLEERAYILEKIYHSDKSLCLELVDTLVQLQKPETAIQYLEALRDANSNPWVFTEDLFLKLVYLKNAGGKPIFEDLISGLKTYKTNTLLGRVIEFYPDKRIEFEEIGKSASHHFYLKYLIEKDRIDEAHQLVLASNTLDDQSILHFFKKYCEKYPGDATAYFIKLIDKELPYTGDHHYESIVNLLQSIFKVNPIKAVEIANSIKKDYKRRRNLMAMLDGVF